jgi:hypothetical protein
METPQNQNNAFQVTTLWCISDEFGSIPIQGLVKSYNGGKIELHGKVAISNVDRMHDLSPEYILIIGNHLTDDCPGYWLPDARDASSPANSVLPL